MSLIFSHEMVLSPKVLIYVSAKLFLNNNLVSLDLLKQQMIKLEITTIDNLTTLIKFDDLQLNYSKDYELEFTLPPKATKLKIKLKGGV